MRRPPRVDYNLQEALLDDLPWFRGRLLHWFDKNQRYFSWREVGKSPYEILVAEILLQRTPAANAARLYPIFLQQYPSWKELSRASVEDLEELLKPLGLAKLKASIFRGLAEFIEARNGIIPTSRAELELIKGIGQYTAGAVLTVVHGEPEPLLDVNMARVLERFFGPRERKDIRDDSYLHTLSRRIVEGKRSLHLNWAILDFSALICRPRPLCHQCPLHDRCRYYAALNNPDVI